METGVGGFGRELGGWPAPVLCKEKEEMWGGGGGREGYDSFWLLFLGVT